MTGDEDGERRLPRKHGSYDDSQLPPGGGVSARRAPIQPSKTRRRLSDPGSWLPRPRPDTGPPGGWRKPDGPRRGDDQRYGPTSGAPALSPRLLVRVAGRRRRERTKGPPEVKRKNLEGPGSGKGPTFDDSGPTTDD